MENHIQKYQSNIPEKNHDGDFVEEIEYAQNDEI